MSLFASPSFSKALLTDLYQLTMASGYWKSGRADREAAFHLFYRSAPFDGSYAVACGLETLRDFLAEFHFKTEDIDYLRGLTGSDDNPLFDEDFLEHLARLRLRGDIDAVPEGTVVFPREPILRVRAPILEAQILETAFLTIVNFQTLIATKAARVAQAAGDTRVLEFGLRRAHGVDGGISASRAAYIGGCAATSNVLAGKLFDIPVKGTHAHSWVMSFESEREAFDTYADVCANNSVLLVDTYDTERGIENAIATGKRLREAGHELVGIRLDSGDLNELSRQARRRLDEAGFEKSAIVASGDLDEHSIAELREKGAPIDIWGVGTKLATAFDEPALGGVYKLGAMRDESGEWSPRMKRSDDLAKATIPGLQQVRRWRVDGEMALDVLYDDTLRDDPRAPFTPPDDDGTFEAPANGESENLLQPFLRAGQMGAPPSDAVEVARRRAREQLESLPTRYRRLRDADAFPVALDGPLGDLRRSLLERIRRASTSREKTEDAS